MNAPLPSAGASSARRLQVILLLLILWDLLALVAEVSFGGPLLKISGNEIGGVLAARGSLSGAAIVPIWLYMYAFVRGPIRHRNILWLAVIEQAAAAFFAVYHVAANDVAIEGAFLPLAISCGLVVVVLVNMPRGQAAV